MSDKGSGMLPYLGQAAKDLRVAAGARQIDIATRCGVSEATVSRFERGKRWPIRTDDLIAAYAREVGVRPRDVWSAALERWR